MVELFRFLVVGVISTLSDWGVFYILAYHLNIHYGHAFIVALVVGGIINYVLNKKFTFQCTSKKLLQQFTVFFALMMVSLLIGGWVIVMLVEWFYVEKMLARIMTTFVMFFVNYVFHKYITFNKRWRG